MQIRLHIGVDSIAACRMQRLLAKTRSELIKNGILFPQSPGADAHTELFMAVTDPAHIDPLRHEHGLDTLQKQHALRYKLAENLAREVAFHKPDILILSAAQLGQSLGTPAALQRLRDLLGELSDDIRIIAQIDEQARMLARHYGVQIMTGRTTPLSRDIALGETKDWWQSCLETAAPANPRAGYFPETQAAPFWLDYQALVDFWQSVFGKGMVTLRPITRDEALTTADMCRYFAIKPKLANILSDPPVAPPSAAWLARARGLNELFHHLTHKGKHSIPPALRRDLLDEIEIAGTPIAPGALAAVSRHFADANLSLVKTHPALRPSDLAPDPAQADWIEADPGNGFRASQYLLAFMYRIDKATRDARKPDGAKRPGTEPSDPIGLSDTARALMPQLAVQNFDKLRKSPYAPHNRLGATNEEELAAAYTPIPSRTLTKGSSGRVIVGCMKNEAPYILEWIAHHRAIGVDNFLIYTNDCTDGTAEILNRLQALGVVQHRNNDKWRGKSPQQHALNQSRKEPLIKNADWIIHIDVDEFINVRTDNGTLDDFFARVPDATNVAMTWRLFGHNGITRLSDDFVIDQFDRCAPKYCPKPHTAWGFKTMFKNIGAYGKIGCHRPNKLADELRDKVLWVNGSGQDMTQEVAQNGWRNSRRSIGYDLLQLNHYALRSAESFLIKRQRGRALHVDRSIGINYWIRMDWSDFRDITIKRNIPRLRAEYDRLLADDTLRHWHQKGRDWHRAKAEELHGMPEFRELYEQALTIKLTETERAAYALALDMES